MSKIKVTNGTTLENLVRSLSFEEKCDLICRMFTYNFEYSSMIRNLMRRATKKPILCALTTKDLREVLEKRGYKLVKVN